MLYDIGQDTEDIKQEKSEERIETISKNPELRNSMISSNQIMRRFNQDYYFTKLRVNEGKIQAYLISGNELNAANLELKSSNLFKTRKIYLEYSGTPDSYCNISLKCRNLFCESEKIDLSRFPFFQSRLEGYCIQTLKLLNDKMEYDFSKEKLEKEIAMQKRMQSFSSSFKIGMVDDPKDLL